MRGVLFFTLWFALLAFVNLACAEDPKTKPSAAPPAAPKSETPVEDLFKRPAEETTQALVEFIERIEKFQPATREQARAFRRGAPEHLKWAAEKIVVSEKDVKSRGFKKAMDLLLVMRVAGIAEMSPADQKKTLGEVKTFLTSGPLQRQHVSVARSVAMGLEYAEQTALATEAYTEFAKIFAANSDPQIQQHAAPFEGAARRLNLVGKPIEIKGNLLDGQPFDWAAYKGKAVLVDFWATWCGPCLAELPNVKKHYELYHDKGFDVVGISIDEEAEPLQKFIDKEKLPWVTLWEKDAGWKNSIATYYGIGGIPTVILVGKNGNVLSLNARGEDLGKLLAQELGPVPEGDEPAPKKPAAKKPAGAAKTD